MATLAATIAARGRPAQNSFARTLIAVVAGSLLVAALAQVSIRLPFTPVPVTGQTLGVLLVGASLGGLLGGAAMLLYLAEGAIGLPFYAGGSHGFSVLASTSATGGYLWGFVVAGALVGWLAQRGWDRSLGTCIGAMFLGELVLYAIAIPWLVGALHVPVEKGFELGLYPFVVGDVMKLLIAAAALPAAWRLLGHRGSR